MHNETPAGICYLDKPLAEKSFTEEEELLVSMMLMNVGITLKNRILCKQINSLERSKSFKKQHVFSEKYLKGIIKYINTHYAEEICREDIAETLGISPDYIGRIFKSYTGKAIHRYVNDIRIKKAAERLLNSSDKIIDIAMGAGFDSIRTFNRVFFRIMSVRPSEYREKITSIKQH